MRPIKFKTVEDLYNQLEEMWQEDDSNLALFNVGDIKDLIEDLLDHHKQADRLATALGTHPMDAPHVSEVVDKAVAQLTGVEGTQ
jgi:hypothetical protein